MMQYLYHKTKVILNILKCIRKKPMVKKVLKKMKANKFISFNILKYFNLRSDKNLFSIVKNFSKKAQTNESFKYIHTITNSPLIILNMTMKQVRRKFNSHIL